MRKKYAVKLLSALSMLLFTVGCASFPRDDVSRSDSDIVESFYDTAVVVNGASLDTGKVKVQTVYYSNIHYSFKGIDKDADTAILIPIKDPFLKTAIPAAVANNLGAKFTLTADSANADAICRSVSFEEEYTYTTYYDYWYGGGYYYYYPPYYYTTTYTIGTIIVDLSYPTGELNDSTGRAEFFPIWLGVGTGLTSNNTGADIQPRVTDMINKMYIQSPYLKANY
jgi:hypothetical protein